VPEAARGASDNLSQDVELVPALEPVRDGQDQLERANRQIKRLLGERKINRAEIRSLKAQLAEAMEALRRSNFGTRAKHGAELTKPSTSTRS
jgi:hypothetical protein